MTSLATIRHHGAMRTRVICDTEVATITTSGATEVFARCAPIASGTSKNGCRMQSRVLYESLAQALDQAGAELGHVVIEKAFFRRLEENLNRRARERGGIDLTIPAAYLEAEKP